MIEFDVKSKTQPVGKRKGKKVYFAYPKPQQYMTCRTVVDSIVRETSREEKRIGQRTPVPQGRTGRPPVPGRHSCRRTMNAGGTGDCEKK